MKKNKLLKILLFSLLLVPVVGVTTKILNTKSNNVNITIPNKSDNIVNEVAVTLDDNSTVMSSNIQIVSNKQEVLSASKDKLCIVNDNKDLNFKMSQLNKDDLNIKDSRELNLDYENQVYFKYGNYGFLFYGSDNQSIIYKYNFDNYSYELLNCQMPVNTDYCNFIVIDNSVYIYNNNNDSESVYLNKVYKFNLDNYNIDIIDYEFNEKFLRCNLEVYNNKIYMFGSYDDNLDYTDEVLVLDCATGEITIDCNLPFKYGFDYSFILDDNIYLIYGYDNDGNEHNNIFKYNISSKSIVTMDLSIPFEFNNTRILTDENYCYILNRDSSDDVYKLDVKNNDLEKIETTYENPLTSNEIWFDFPCIYNNKIIDFNNNNFIDLNTYSLSKIELNDYIELPHNFLLSTASIFDDYIYIFGGLSKYSNKSNDIYKYDTKNKNGQIIDTKIPYNFKSANSYRYKDYIYIYGGYETVTSEDGMSSSAVPNTSIYKFNCLTETFELLDLSLPYGNNGLFSSIYKDNIYIFNKSKITKFNLSNETLTVLDVEMPEELYNCSICTHQDNLYIFGGRTANSTSNKIYKFNSLNETIELLEVTLPFSCVRGGCIEYNDEIYIFGGYNGGSFTNENYSTCKFNPLTKTIVNVNGSISRHYRDFDVLSHNGLVYVLGGSTEAGYDLGLNKMFILSSCTNLSKNSIVIYKSETGKPFKLNNEIDVSISKIFIENSLKTNEYCEAYLYDETQTVWVNVNTGAALEVGDSNA